MDVPVHGLDVPFDPAREGGARHLFRQIQIRHNALLPPQRSPLRHNAAIFTATDAYVAAESQTHRNCSGSTAT